MAPSDPEIGVANEGELEGVLALQKRAFATAAELCGDWSIPPLVQTLDQLAEECRASLVLVARSDGALVGTVRSRWEGDTVHVCRLAVDPAFRRRGIARRLLAELESRALAGKPAPARFALFTAEVDRGAVALYEGCGYRILRTERPAAGPALVHMEKPAAG